MNEPTLAARLRRVDTWMGILALVLALVTVIQAAVNRDLQKKIAEGQLKIARAQTLAALNNSLIQLMAKTAVDNNDQALRALLAKNGVTFQPPAPETPPTAAPSAPAR